MDFYHFLASKDKLINAQLGGKQSQFKLAPPARINFPDENIQKSNPKIAAVLALFFPDQNNKTQFLLTKRGNYKGTHSAQISFVGGKCEEGETFKQTALRETFEEVGICSSEINIIRQLSKIYIPPSNFLVYPFLATMNTVPNFKPNYEVAEIINVNIENLLQDKLLMQKEFSTSYMKKSLVPYFNLNNNIVWGATAMILSEIKDLLKENL